MTAAPVNERRMRENGECRASGISPLVTLHPKRTTRRARSISLMERSSLTLLAHRALYDLTCRCGTTLQRQERALTTASWHTPTARRGPLKPERSRHDRGPLLSRQCPCRYPARPVPEGKRHGGRTTSRDPRLALTCCAAAPFIQWPNPWAPLLRRRSDPAHARRSGQAPRCAAHRE